MKKILLMLFCIVTLSFLLMNCKKETINPVTQEQPKKAEANAQKTATANPNSVIAGCDYNCNTNSKVQTSNLALRLIEFGVVPSTVSYDFTLASAADVAIFAQDCCIRDDVVEIWVDGCLRATVDSRDGPFGSHPGETHTVTLAAGNHTINYVNTVSLPGPSGWYVSETELPASNIIIGTCNSGVPNINVGAGCGSSMSSMIAACAVGAANHGAFVSCVAALTNTWKKAGLITGAQKDAIMSCAGSSNIP